MKLDRKSRLGFLVVLCFLFVQVQHGGYTSAQKPTKPQKEKPAKATKPTKPPPGPKPSPGPKPQIFKCGAKTDLVFLIDSSTSVSTSGFKNVLDFIIGMLRHADINSGNVRVGLMTYQSRPEIHFHLNKHLKMAALEKAIKAVPYSPGSTNAALALKMMRESMFTAPSGDRNAASNVAMLITDGVSNLDAERTVPEAVASHQQGIHIFVVGIGLTDTLELEQMASPPGRENLFLVKSFDELTQAQIRTKTFKKMCDMVILNGRATTSRPTPPPTTTSAKDRCPRLADIAFLVDSSSSLSDAEFQEVQLLMTDLILDLPVDGGNKVRVSITSYASTPRTYFTLDRYKTANDILHEIAVMLRQGGGRNLNAAVRSLQTQVFVEGKGDRPEALNVVVIVTRTRLDENTRTVAQSLSLLEDTHVMIVGVGDDEGRELWDLVTQPRSSNLFLARSFQNATALKKQILAQICEVGDSYVYVPRLKATTTEATSTVRATTTATTARPTTTQRTTQRTIPTTRRTTPTTRRVTTAGSVPTTSSGPRTTTPKYDCRVSGDLVWLIDSSGSVGQQNFRRTLDFVANLTSHLDIDSNMYRVALVTFSDADNPVFDLTNRSRDDVLARIESTRYLYGSTNIYSALRRTRTQLLSPTGRGNRPNAPDLTILITDGQSNVYAERTVPEARLLKRQGVALAGIGINMADHRELDEMVSEPSSKFSMVINDFDDLGALQPELVQLLCHSTDQCRSSPCKNGGDCSSVFDEYFCKCLSGFTGRECQKSCQTKSDVVFVLDSSGSVGEVNFDQMKDFLKRFLYEIDVESCNFRIGVLKFGSSAFVQFHLNSYTTTEDLTAAIDNIRYSHGFTYTADALRVARESMFQRARGDRPDARNVLVVLTEGLANVHTRQTLEEVRKARNAGIHLVPIGIGSNNREEMNAMATHERGIFSVDRFSQLENITTPLADYILEDVDQCQPNPCQNGGVCEDRIHDFVCKCAPGFSGEACARGCSSQSDIAFLVDTTSYMGPQNFAKVKDFVKNLVDRLALWNGESRVGLVTFSGAPTIRRYLNEPATKDDILGAIHALQYDGGYPSTTEALDLLSYKLFTGPNGDRPHAHNYAVLITAGQLYSEFELPRNQQPRHAGIHVFGIGIGLQEGDKRRMNEIVSDPQASAFTADDPDRLNEIAEKIATVICEDPDQCSRSPCQNKGKCIDAVNSFSCQCIAGYAGTECEKECPSRADVVFLVDSSGSIGRRNFARSLDFLSSLVAELNIDADYTRVAMITFSSKAKIVFYLDSHKNVTAVQRAIHSAQFVYGDANTADAFLLARGSIFSPRHGDRQDVRNLIVLLTDGIGNVAPTRTIPEAEKCREAGIHVLSVGIGMANPSELEEIVSEPKNDNVFPVSDFGNLNSVLAKVFEAVCDDGDSCDSNQCENNGTCVDGIRTFKCLCTDGYSGRNCEKGYPTQIDLAFVIDSSVSVGRRNFNKVLDFIASFARALPINSRTARIALVTYSNSAAARMYLSSYVRRDDVLRRIENLEFDRGGSTNTAEALRVLREDVFNIYRGDRPTAANVAVLITDGVSNVMSQWTLPEAVKVHEDGIHVYAIGVGMNDTKEVEGIASKANTFYKLRSYDELEKLGSSLLDEFMELKPIAKVTPKATVRPTVLPPTPPRATTLATTTIATTLRPTTTTLRTTTKVITLPPTTPTTPKPTLRPGEACNKRLDLVFAFDSSGGLPRPQFTRTLDFAKRFVGQMNVGADETRIGAISFSNNIRTAFHLKDTSTLQDVQNRLGRMPYRPGKRELKQGMNAIRDTMFLEQNGNRGSVPDVAIIFTDGFSGEEAATYDEESFSIAERGIELFQIVWQQKGRDVVHTGERVFAVNSVETLNGILEDVKQAVCDVAQS